jgi:hypothetical protein
VGPLGTAATNRPIVPVPRDYDDGETGGMIIGKGNRSTRRKPAPVPHTSYLRGKVFNGSLLSGVWFLDCDWLALDSMWVAPTGVKTEEQN